MNARKRNRLKHYDYSQNGVYFITICAKGHKQLFGAIDVGAACGCPQLSNIGKLIEAEISRLSQIYSGIYVDCYTIMPNHLHMVIVIGRESRRPQAAPTISHIINQFKGVVSKRAGFSIWQKSFHDHIIRNEADYIRIAEYIENNPLKWTKDRYYTKEE